MSWMDKIKKFSKNNTSGIIYLCIFLVVIGYLFVPPIYSAIKKSYENKAASKELEASNMPRVFSDGNFQITFPCQDINKIPILQDEDFNVNMYSCIHFGGDQLDQLDTYIVQTDEFLSRKYNPANDTKCEDSYDELTNKTSHSIYHEVRNIDNLNIHICAWDTTSLVAIVANSNIVYRIQALPKDETQTYNKLNEFLATFQLK